MTQVFDESYYRSNNYVDYLSKRERYVKTAEEIQQVFYKFSVIDPESTILDYGCSLGFLMLGFTKLGFKHVSGFDISTWAVAQARNNGCHILDQAQGTFDLGIFLDVLEHMTDQQISDLFDQLRLDKVLVRIPCAVAEKPDQFYLEVSRRDPTHINCKTDQRWIELFKKLGYQNHFRLNMSTIYDSPGCFCCLFV
jgi:SAM-dependent methyltransferase